MFLIFTVLNVTTVNAWWGVGHLLITRMTQMILEERSPEIIPKMETLLSHLQHASAHLTINERDHPFVECVNFADFVKEDGKPGIYQRDWHVVNNPLFLREEYPFGAIDDSE